MRAITILAALSLVGLVGLAGCASPALPPAPAPAPEPAPERVWPHSDVPDSVEWDAVRDFPGVEQAYHFIHDYGARWYGARLDGRYYAPEQMSGPVLASIGWAAADAERRTAVALDYCRQLLRWVDLQWKRPADFDLADAPAYTPVTAEWRDGRVVVRAWCDDTIVGMRPPMFREYRLHEAVFGPDGAVQTRIVASYDAPA